jgi:hypothetical protein
MATLAREASKVRKCAAISAAAAAAISAGVAQARAAKPPVEKTSETIADICCRLLGAQQDLRL